MSAAAASVASPMSAPAANFKTRASNCVLLTISVIAMCVLIVCGVKIVREYSLARGYQAATCQVVSVDYADHGIECFFCGAGAKDKTKEKGAGSCVESHFPCLEVRVEYRSKQFGIREGILHPDSIQSNGIFGKCSYDICLKKPEENTVKIEEWSQPWRRKHERKDTFDCYFNTENPNDVITEKKHTGNEVIHSMVWPCLIIFICGIIFIHLEKQRRGMNFCGDGHSKRGLADGAEAHLHGSDTMLRWQPGKDRAECQLVAGCDDAANVSSSLSSLERLQKSDDPLLSNGRPGTSKSYDNVKNRSNNSDTKALLSDSNTDTPGRIAIVVDPPSTGHRNGLPV